MPGSSNFLDFTARRNYDEQLKDAYAKGGNTDSIEIYSGEVKGKSVILGIMNFGFIGGSMGSVVGELISRAIVRARKENKPLILVCKSGGARMQEGAISLMQLAKMRKPSFQYLAMSALIFHRVFSEHVAMYQVRYHLLDEKQIRLHLQGCDHVFSTSSSPLLEQVR